MIFENYLKWIKAHERLIIIAILVLFSWRVYDSARQAYVDHLKRQDDVAAQAAQVSNAASVQVQQQLADLKKQVDSQTAATNAAMVQRAVDVQKQKQSDDALAGQQLAARLQVLLSVTPQDVTWSPIQGDLVFTPPAAHAVADAVDDRNKLTADVVSLNSELDGQKSLVVEQTTAIVSANLALVDEQKSHKKDVDLLNQQMKTKWQNGFKWGVIVGTVGTVVAERLFGLKL